MILTHIYIYIYMYTRLDPSIYIDGNVDQQARGLQRGESAGHATLHLKGFEKRP